jgi:carbamoyl-phosphate synthase small subunit
MTTAKLALEDGTVFTGISFGASGEISGEVVFNTAMTGYQEIITDPSYKGQIVTMTHPLIGNYGINPEDMESQKPWLEGFVCREISRVRSNFRSSRGLDEWLAENNILAIEDIDTRALTRLIRDKGAMTGVLSTEDLDDASLVAKAKAAPKLEEKDLVREVTGESVRHWDGWVVPGPEPLVLPDSPRFTVAAYDYGIKHNIVRSLVALGCDVTVFPATAAASDLLAINPDGIFLSNGPGDPEKSDYAVRNVKEILTATEIPVFGICLGHQILSKACGAGTFKLKFGHHGANHPVQNVETRKVEITSQNHGFAVESDGIGSHGLEVTHWNLNDQTVEGVRMVNRAAFSVQYHPEAAPGPHDASYLFHQFVDVMKNHQPARV